MPTPNISIFGPLNMHILVLVLVSTILPLVNCVDKTSNPDLSAKLKVAATNLDRHSILQPSDWIFDFSSQPTYTFSPGSVVNANAATFPALTGIGMTIAMLNLGPCAMLPPHSHPRANNLVTALTGNTTTWMLAENGVDVVSTELTPMKMTIFEKGSLHSMQNNGCDSSQLLSALDSEDAGTINHVNGVFGLPADMVKAAFGMQYTGLDIGSLGREVPPVGTGSVLGSEECMKRCGIRAVSTSFYAE